MSCVNGFNLGKDSVEHYLDLASRHRKSQRDDLIPRVRKILQENPAIVYNKATKQARQFYLRGREVLGEYHRLNAFIRFEAYPEYLLVSEVRPEHDILDLMFNYFQRRYPDYILLLYGSRAGNLSTRRPEIQFPPFKYNRNYWSFPRRKYSLKDIREMLRDQLSDLLVLDEFSTELWEKYYDSQYIQARKNIPLARKTIPRKMVTKAAGGLAYEAKRFDEEENNRQKNSLLDYL